MAEIKTILLVDDDFEDQEIFEDVINELNKLVKCICVDTAEDALQTLKNTPKKPDIIFLDLNLPFMNGFDCLSQIKRQHDLQNIPVIVYSTSSRETDRQKAIELGANDYLIKANTFSELKRMLANVID